MDAVASLQLALDPGEILRAQGLAPDPWQQDFLLSNAHDILLNCCRGAGKSRTASALAVHTAIFRPKSLILLISRAQRQARELMRYCKQGLKAIGWPIPAVKENEGEVELANGSRIVALPGTEATIRSFQGVNLLLIDEASRVTDDLAAAVSPMIAIAKGRRVALSTPFGQRGWFFREWHDERSKAIRFRIDWTRCPRHRQEFIDDERRKYGDSFIAQEYECSFESVSGLVYPDFHQCLVDTWPVEPAIMGSEAQRTGFELVGGLDFGFRNPFAALWGYRDLFDVLHICHEHYARELTLRQNLDQIEKQGKRSPTSFDAKQTLWYADPAGAGERHEMLSAGWKVRKGNNDIMLGIQAVTARIRTGRLKVYRLGCPNLIQEAKLYRYPDESERAISGEKPIDDHNHALGALRYLISRLDWRLMAKLKKGKAPEEDGQGGESEAQHKERMKEAAAARHQARLWDDDESWETL